jgi:3'-phosphoadenosine 5'-phosphosulfate sulfotransferase (PAPS reductase)/FAD synthetase
VVVINELIDPQRILSAAIEAYQPRALVCLYSGGYDSAITTHIVRRLDTHGLPLDVWSIDTKLAADGWHDYVCQVARGQGWRHRIYDNEKGFRQFVKFVTDSGCPRTKAIHSNVYQKLKERGIDAIHMLNKTDRHDRTLFVTGRRRAESPERADVPEIESFPKNNKRFASPIVHWSNEQCDFYRIDHGLPDNPFYNTVKGSGDCQCNWGTFITLRTLQKYSPKLAAGNVALIDKISRENHGYGWDGAIEGQTEMFEDFDGDAELTTPFLCAGCSRRKVRAPGHIVEARILQAGLFD